MWEWVRAQTGREELNGNTGDRAGTRRAMSLGTLNGRREKTDDLVW